MAKKGIGTFAAKATLDTTDFTAGAKTIVDTARGTTAKIKAQATEVETAAQIHQKRVEALVATTQKRMAAAAESANVRRDANLKMFGTEQSPAELAAALRMKMTPAGQAAGEELADNTYHGFLKGLNSQFGKRSDFGKTLKLLAGGGVIGAAGMAASEILASAKAIESMALAFDKGEVSAGKMTAEVIKSIPIVGKLGDAFQTIFNLNETILVARMHRTTEMVNAVTDSTKTAIGIIQQARAETVTFANEIERMMRLRGTSPADKSREEINVAEERAVEQQQNGLKNDKELAALKEKADKQAAEAQKSLDAANRRMQDIQDAGFASKLFGSKSGRVAAFRQAKDEAAAAASAIVNAQTAYEAAKAAKAGQAEKNITAIRKDAADQRFRQMEDEQRQETASAQKAMDEKLEQQASDAKRQAERAAKAWETMQKQGRSFANAADTPADKLKSDLAEMTALLDMHAMTWDQYKTAVNGRMAQEKSPENRLSSAMSFGGGEDMKMRLLFQSGKSDSAKDPVRVALDAYEEARKQTTYQDAMKRALDSMANPTVVDY